MTELRVGLVGTGHISTSHLSGWRRTGAQVVGVLDVDTQAAQAFAAAHGIARVHADLEALVEAVDVVDVATPPQTHAAIALTAAAAGRHLLVEKPVVIELDDWRQLRAAVTGSSTQLAVVHNLKFARAILTAQRWMEAGRIGRLLRFHRRFLTDSPSDRMLGGGHWSHGLPGGRWFETLPHELYLLHYLAGPLTLASVAVQAGEPVAGAAAGEVVVTLAGADAIAVFEFSAHCGLNRRALELIGSEGSIAVDILGDAAVLSRARDSRWRRGQGGPFIDAAATLARWPADRAHYLADRLRGDTPHTRLIAAFARHLRGEGPSPTPLDEIDYVVRLSHEIGEAIDRRLRDLGDAPS